MASTMVLASLGGLISFLSTGFGALLSLKSLQAPRFARFKFSIDFALGLMLSAVAFSLVGPAATQSLSRPGLLVISLMGFAMGGFAIYALKTIIERRQKESSIATSSQLVLAIALIAHNLPEGLASGASLAGLSLNAAAPILTSISLQNVPEGLLMVLCLRGMGWTRARSLTGGFVSGLVEMIGGVFAGIALSWTTEALPFLLMMAGGAMFVSVAIEIREKGNFRSQFRKPEFALGLLSIPLLNSFLGW